MKKLLAFALLMMVCAVLAFAADAPAAPILAQGGPPDDFPGGGNSCRIPPPFQPESCICPFIFDPVCGCNGVTYSNACFASCEVRFFTQGACE